MLDVWKLSLELSGTLRRRESGASSGLIVLVTHGLVVDPSHLSDDADVEAHTRAPADAARHDRWHCGGGRWGGGGWRHAAAA
eukprot:5355546-Prymnesium_polylepis.1